MWPISDWVDQAIKQTCVIVIIIMIEVMQPFWPGETTGHYIGRFENAFVE